MKPETLLSIEDSVTQLLQSSWLQLIATKKTRLYRLLEDDKFDVAYALIHSIDLSKAIDGHVDALKKLANASLLFGASRIRPVSEVQVLGTKGIKSIIQNSVRVLRLTLSDTSKSYQRRLLSIITREVDRQAALVKMELVENFMMQLDKALVDGGGRLRLASSLHSSRLASYGFTVEAEIVSQKTYIINALLDARTCIVCAEMNGKVFETHVLKQNLERVFRATTGDEVKRLAPFIPATSAGLTQLQSMTSEEIQASGLSAPPFHFLCRCFIDFTEQEMSREERRVDDRLDVWRGLKNPKREVPEEWRLPDKIETVEDVESSIKALRSFVEAVESSDVGDGQFVEDDCLTYLTNLLELDKKPVKLTTSEFNQVLDPERTFYRGLSEEAFVDQFFDGEFFIGRGIYGNGTYGAVVRDIDTGFERARSVAKEYSSIVGGVMRGVVHESADIVDYDYLYEIFRGEKVYQLLSDARDNAQLKMFEVMDEFGIKSKEYAKAKEEYQAFKDRIESLDSDYRSLTDRVKLSSMAILQGKDCIYVSSEDYIVILNRGVIGVDYEAPRFAKDFFAYDAQVVEDLFKSEGVDMGAKAELSQVMGKVTNKVIDSLGYDFVHDTWIPAYESSDSVNDLPQDVKDVLDKYLKEVE